MQGRALIILIVLAIILHTGSTLKCYDCISKMNAKCLDPSELESKECTPDMVNEASSRFQNAVGKVESVLNIDIIKDITTSQQLPMVCQKLEVEIAGQNVTTRSCQVADGIVNICEKLKNKLTASKVKVFHCSTCDSDDCNSAPFANMFNTSTIMFIAIANIFIKLCVNYIA